MIDAPSPVAARNTRSEADPVREADMVVGVAYGGRTRNRWSHNPVLYH
jgi:hypothetical protein